MEEEGTYRGPGCDCILESLWPVDGNHRLAGILLIYCYIKK